MRSAQLILQAFGWRGLLRRATYLAQLRSGLLKRQLPVQEDFSGVPRVPWTHRFDLEAIRRGYDEAGITETARRRVVADAERVLSGQLQLYGDRWHDVGWPPRWHRNVFSGYEYPQVHWTAIHDNVPEWGDIKDVWELSRLSFTYLLARALVLTGDDRYAEAWWQAVEDWAHTNPPNVGVNWRCGQETSLRAITLCFGLSVFADRPASTTGRLDLAGRILGASLRRVQSTLGYALSQRNNHAVSELALLLSVDPPHDRSLVDALIEVVDDQFYPDGSYSQQSFTYQRLAVQALQWLILARPTLPPGARTRVIDALARSRDFLSRCSDPVSGRLPNYGPNDGALLFHLSAMSYRDFRPLLASLGAPMDPAHREEAIWLENPDVTARRSSANQVPSTYITVRGPRSLALSRIGTGRHRTAHADQQVIDVWIAGRNVVVDPGTYRYTAPEPWMNPLAHAEVHSLPLEMDSSQVSLGRFLTEGIPAAELVAKRRNDDFEVVVSRRPAGKGHFTRGIVRRGDAYAVVDAAEGVDGHVRWNLGELEGIEVRMTPRGKQNEPPAEDDPASGWVSQLYGLRQPVEVRSVRLPEGTSALCLLAPADQPQLGLTDIRRALAGTELAGVEILAVGAVDSQDDTDGRYGTRGTERTE